MRLNLSLSAKINAIIVAAVLIPLLALGFLMFRTIRTIALDNLESFVQENGSRRQAAIEADVRESLSQINEFVADNESLLVAALFSGSETQNGIPIDFSGTEAEVQARLQTRLIDQELIDSAQLLNLQYTPIANAGDAPSVIATRQIASSGVGSLSVEQVTPQTFIIGAANDLPVVRVLNAVRFEDNEGNREIVGYLLTTLNVDQNFTSNLTFSDEAFETAAYVIIQRDDQTILFAPQILLDTGRYDVDSIGARRALSNRASAVDSYSIETGDETINVIGYASSFTISGEQFALVTEVDSQIILTSITQQALGQTFVLTVFAAVLILIFGLLAANQLILPPIRSLRSAILAVIRGDFEAPVTAIERSDEFGSLATSFVDMREYVRDLTDDMNRRLRDRTRDVQVTQEIAKAVTNERDLNTLMSRVVNLIVQNFPSIYHAQIFMIDDAREFAVLRASTGAAGRELLSRGHKLGVGSVSVIGQVTEQGQVIIARDTAESNLHRQNEFLGDTRAELAIPLQLGDSIIGALDVQSMQRDSFDPDQVAALSTLADQITIAIENTRLYTESERLLNETRHDQAQSTRQAWQQYLYNQRQSDMAVTSGTNTGHNFKRLTDAVLRSGEPIVGSQTSRNTIPFVVPVKLREQTLGVVEYEVPASEFEYDKVLLAQELVSRLAISLENARLFQASQEATDRERIVNDISAKLTSQTDIQSILETAVREIEQALRTPQVAIRLAGVNGNGTHANGTTSSSNGNHPDDPMQ